MILVTKPNIIIENPFTKKQGKLKRKSVEFTLSDRYQLFYKRFKTVKINFINL